MKFPYAEPALRPQGKYRNRRTGRLPSFPGFSPEHTFGKRRGMQRKFLRNAVPAVPYLYSPCLRLFRHGRHMRFPFRPSAKAAAMHFVSVFEIPSSIESVQLCRPHAADTVTHREKPAAGHHEQFFTPFCEVFDMGYQFHIRENYRSVCKFNFYRLVDKHFLTDCDFFAMSGA